MQMYNMYIFCCSDNIQSRDEIQVHVLISVDHCYAHSQERKCVYKVKQGEILLTRRA